SPGEQEDLFERVPKKWRVYRRLGSSRHDKISFPEPRDLRPNLPAAPLAAVRPTLGRIAGLAQQLLVERYVPASVVINRKGEILHFAGPTQDYLAQPSGAPTPSA